MATADLKIVIDPTKLPVIVALVAQLEDAIQRARLLTEEIHGHDADTQHEEILRLRGVISRIAAALELPSTP